MSSKVFYSWQSDLPNATNRGLIQKALENVATAITADESVDVEPVIDRDTQDVPGSPDITSTIFSKIDAAHVVVSDVSIINSGFGGRPCPNPNVLIELGYAFRAKGHERVILVFNTAFGKMQDLPFDLRTRRLVNYHMPEEEEDRASTRKVLEQQLDVAIRAALNHVPTPASSSGMISPTEHLSELEKKILRKLYSSFKTTGRQLRWNIKDAYQELGVKEGDFVGMLNDSKVVALEGDVFVMTTDGIRYMDSRGSQFGPVVDLERNFVVSGGPNGNYITVVAKNIGTEPALDIKVSLQADDTESPAPEMSLTHLLAPGEKTNGAQFRYTDTDFFKKSLSQPRIVFTYKNGDGETFTSGRYITQDARADGRFNIHGTPGKFFKG